ncbi:MAG: hypothetical protein HKL87_07945 [Acidimicrobiaceae bacterium]|nr:hypothetical protein [Acidimicrobiaceae bacterium]
MTRWRSRGARALGVLALVVTGGVLSPLAANAAGGFSFQLTTPATQTVQGLATIDFSVNVPSGDTVHQVCFAVNGNSSLMSNDGATIIFSNNLQNQAALNSQSCYANIDQGGTRAVAQSITFDVQADTTPWVDGSYAVTVAVTDARGVTQSGPTTTLLTRNPAPAIHWTTPPSTVAGKTTISFATDAARPGTSHIAEVCFLVNNNPKRLRGNYIKIVYSNGGYWTQLIPGAIGDHPGLQTPTNACIANIDSTTPQNFIGESNSVTGVVTLDTTSWGNGHYQIVPIVTDSIGRSRTGPALMLTVRNLGPSVSWGSHPSAITTKTDFHLNTSASSTGSSNLNMICLDTPGHPGLLAQDLAYVDFANGGRRQVFLTSTGCLPQPVSAVPNSPFVTGLDVTINPQNWRSGRVSVQPTVWDSSNRHRTGATISVSYEAPKALAPHVIRTFCNTSEKIITSTTGTQYRWTYVYVYVWSNYNVTQSPANFSLGITRPC